MNTLFKLTLFSLITLPLLASDYPNYKKTTPSYDLGVEFGIRSDELFWNKGQVTTTILGTDYSPDILSELTWDKLETYYTKIRLEGDHGRYKLKAHYGFGTAHTGDNQDSDYLYSGRQGEFSRSNNEADGSTLQDWSIALGYKYRFLEQLEGILLVGYEYNRQKLEINDGYQTVNAFGSTGPITGLESWYEAKWKGWWIGADMDVKLTESWKILGGYEYHFIDYDANANWNLRTDLNQNSFEHDANGKGTRIRLETQYNFYGSWIATLAYQYSKFTTDSGNDTINFSDGSTATAILNEVEWESKAYSMGILYRF